MVYTDLCSFYFSVFDEHAVDMTLEEFVKLLRGERWKVQVEEYQRLKASGRETEAKKLKRKLAALVIAGRCDGSHAETNLKQWSGDAMLDVDKCNGRVSEFLQVLKDTPWVKAAWRSVSYDGLKLVVRVEAESVDEYRLAYALVAWHVAQLLAFPCDMSCKNPTRPCFASYDPEAFFRPDTEVFPWRRFVTEHPDRVGEILAELKVKTPAGASGPPVAASGMLHTFFNEFLEQNPFVDGKKNEFLLKLGSITRTQQSIFGMVQSQSVCPQCNGEGKIIKNKCKACAGEGIVYGEEVVEVKIPAGVAEGMQLSVNGKGNAGKHNGVPGDLLVVIEEESHPDLIRDENDLIYNLLLSVPTAALGGTVEIPTIDSKVKVKIEPGTQPGKVLRLRGKGLPNVNSYGYSNGTGDLLVNVSVYIPETLNKDEKQALEKMQESDNFKPNTSIKEKIFKKFKNFFD